MSEQKLRDTLQRIKDDTILDRQDANYYKRIMLVHVSWCEEALSQPPTSDEGTPLTDAKAWKFRRMTVGEVEAAIAWAEELERTLHAKERELEQHKRWLSGELSDEEALTVLFSDMNAWTRALKVRLPKIQEMLKHKNDRISELERQLAALPSGYVQVPREPTEAMKSAALSHPFFEKYEEWRRDIVGGAFVLQIWDAMLSATPTPSDSKPGEGKCQDQ